MKITVTQIVNKNHEAIPIICQWLQEWWGDGEDFSPEKMEAYVKNSLCTQRIPQTYFMEVDGVAAGTFQLSMTDIDVRPDIYPWLINVYIEPRFRGQGLFPLLMSCVKDCAWRHGFMELFLFTKHKGLYEKFNWILVENFQTYNKDMEIQGLYRFDLENAAFDNMDTSIRKSYVLRIDVETSLSYGVYEISSQDD